ncbi:MAG: ABC transporter substrate-binding protein [Anaerolineales bacterium]|nr:ABC transporter substrate-binding protein [Anaerolineales bacterium]
MKRLMLVVSLLVTMSLLLTACGPETIVETVVVESEGETIVVTATPQPADETEVVFDRSETLYVSGAAWGPPSTWNPFQPGSLANTTGTIGYVYEFLFAYDPLQGVMTPWLAEAGEWVDDTTFAVTMRDGLTWSDGEPLTAEDVAFTYELGQMYETMWFAPMWNYLDAITVVDDLNLELTFTDPLYQEFENNLYNIPIVPKHLWEGRSEEEITVGANENPIGSGAYLYESHSEDRNVWLRNDNWWGIDIFGAPAPRRIVDIRTSSNNVALGMVLKGEIDLSNNFLPGVAELAEKGYVDTYYAGAPYMLSANTAVLFLNNTKPPMDDPAFRRALAFSINIDDIVNVAYANLVKAANPTGLLPTLDKFVDQDIVDQLGYTYDPDEAKAILTAAGYTLGDDGLFNAPDGSDIELEVTCPFGWTDWMEAINVISASAQEAGINVVAATPDYGAWNDAMQTATFDMTLNNWANLSNTPWTLYNLLFRHPIQDVMQSGNFGHYDDQEMFDLVDALARVPMSDEAGMQAACSAIQEKMLTDVPMIPLWYNGMWAQFNSSVWMNWPTESTENQTLPTTWSGYWQLGGLQTLINLEPVPVE